MPRLRGPLVAFWALPSPVQDAILEQAALSFNIDRVMRLRLVCKHFDRHIRRLVFGHGLIDPWGYLSGWRIDFEPIPQYLFERCRIRNVSNKGDLIMYLTKQIREITLKLDVQNEEEQIRIAKTVCQAAADAVKGFGRELSDKWARSSMNDCGVPSSVAAALGLVEEVASFDLADLELGHPMFAMPFKAVASVGRHEMVSILCERIGFANIDQWHRLVKLAVWGEHCETVGEFIRVMPGEREKWYLEVYKVLCVAIHARRPRVFKMLIEMLELKTIWGTQNLTEILDLAVLYNSHDILRFMIHQPELDPAAHGPHCPNPCWGCQAIGTLIFRATTHKNNDPLRIILQHGYHPDTLPTGRRATPNDLYGLASDMADRKSTLLLLHQHGADFTLNLDAKFQDMVLSRQVKMIRLIGRIRDETFNQGCFDRALELAQDNDLRQVARALLNAGADPRACQFMSSENWENAYFATVDDADATSESRGNARRLAGRSSSVVPGSWEWWKAVDSGIAYVKWMKMVAFPWTGEF